jgi:hypothetical protein
MLVEHVETYAKARYGCHPRQKGFHKDLTDNLHQLSFLAGFTDADT